jgi:hypothetical protein
MVTPDQDDPTWAAVIGAIVVAALSYLLGRLNASVGKREQRDASTKRLVLAAGPIIEHLRSNLKQFREANQQGDGAVYGYFSMILEVVPGLEATEFFTHGHEALHYSYSISMKLRAAADAVRLLERRHRTIRDGLAQTSEWRTEREAYLHLVSDALTRMREAMGGLRRPAPRESRKEIDEMLRPGGK